MPGFFFFQQKTARDHSGKVRFYYQGLLLKSIKESQSHVSRPSPCFYWLSSLSLMAMLVQASSVVNCCQNRYNRLIVVMTLADVMITEKIPMNRLELFVYLCVCLNHTLQRLSKSQDTKRQHQPTVLASCNMSIYSKMCVVKKYKKNVDELPFCALTNLIFIFKTFNYCFFYCSTPNTCSTFIISSVLGIVQDECMSCTVSTIYPFFPVFLGCSDSRPSRCVLYRGSLPNRNFDQVIVELHSFCSIWFLSHKQLKKIS